MNRFEFTKSFAQTYGLPFATAKEVCKLLDFLAETIKREDKVYLFGLGTFKHETRKGRNVRHPTTGEMIQIPEHDEITFTLSATGDSEDGADS